MASPKQRRVLVADDNPGVRELLEETLALMGWTVDTTAHGGDAIERARATRPDLIILDLMMPGLDGFSALTKIRSDAHLSRTPVVLMSGEPASVQASIGSELGASAYIEKPIELSALRKTIEEVLAAEPIR